MEVVEALLGLLGLALSNVHQTVRTISNTASELFLTVVDRSGAHTVQEVGGLVLEDVEQVLELGQDSVVIGAVLRRHCGGGGDQGGQGGEGEDCFRFELMVGWK